MNTDSLNFGMHTSNFPRASFDVAPLSGLNIKNNELDHLEQLSVRIRESMSQLNTHTSAQKQTNKQLPKHFESIESQALDSLIKNSKTPVSKFKLAFDKFELKNLETATNDDLRDLIVNLRQAPLIKIMPQAVRGLKASNLTPSLPKSITNVLTQDNARNLSDSHFIDKLEILAKQIKIHSKYVLRRFFDEFKDYHKKFGLNDGNSRQLQYQMSMPVTQVEKTLVKRNSYSILINEAEMCLQENEQEKPENLFTSKLNEQVDFVKMNTHTYGDRHLHQSRDLPSPRFDSKNTLYVSQSSHQKLSKSSNNLQRSVQQFMSQLSEDHNNLKSFNRLITKNSAEVASMMSDDIYARLGVVREPQGSIQSSRTFQDMIALYQETEMFVEDQAGEHLDKLYRDTIHKIDEEQLEELQNGCQPFYEIMQNESNRYHNDRKSNEQVHNELINRLAEIHVDFVYSDLIADHFEEALQNRSTNMRTNDPGDSPNLLKKKSFDLFSRYQDYGSNQQLYESYASVSKRHSQNSQVPINLFAGNFMNKLQSHLGFEILPTLYNSNVMTGDQSQLKNDQRTNGLLDSFKERSQSQAVTTSKPEDYADEDSYGVDQFDSRKLSIHSNDYESISGPQVFAKNKTQAIQKSDLFRRENNPALYDSEADHNPDEFYTVERQSEFDPPFAFNLKNKIAHYSGPDIEQLIEEEFEDKPTALFDPSISPISEFMKINENNFTKKTHNDRNFSDASKKNIYNRSKASSKKRSNQSKKSMSVDRSNLEDTEFIADLRKVRSSQDVAEIKRSNMFYEDIHNFANKKNLGFRPTPNATNLGHEDALSGNKKSTLSGSSYPKVQVRMGNDDADPQANDWSKFNQHSRNLSDNETEKNHSQQYQTKVAKTKMLSLKRFSIIQLAFQPEFQSYSKLFHSHRNIKRDSKVFAVDLNEELAKAQVKKAKVSNSSERKAETEESKGNIKTNSLAERGIRSIVENLDEAFEEIQRSSRMNNGTIVDNDEHKDLTPHKKVLQPKETKVQQKEVEVTSQEESESECALDNDDSILNQEFINSRIDEIQGITSRNSLKKQGQHTPHSRSRADSCKSIESQEFILKEEPRYKDFEETENNSMILKGYLSKPLLYDGGILTRKNSLGRISESREAVPSRHIENHKSVYINREPTKLSKLIEFKHDIISLSEAELVQIETDYSIKCMEAMNRTMAENKGKSGKFIADKLKEEMDKIFSIPFVIQITRPSTKFLKAVVKIQSAFRRMRKSRLEAQRMKHQSRAFKSVTYSTQVRVLQRKRV